MNTNTPFERVLEGWLDAEGAGRAPAGLHGEAVALAQRTRQRPRWLTVLRGTTFAGLVSPSGRRVVRARLDLRWAVAAAAVVTVTVVAGLVLRRAPAVTVGPSASPSETTPASPAASDVPTGPPAGPARVFAFNKGGGTSAECGNDGRGGCIPRLWVANLDGTGAHELLPDQSGCQRVQAWSPDGTRLLFSRSECRLTVDGMTGAERFYLTDASGSEPQLVDTGCVSPCLYEDDAVYSSDGRQILFVRTMSVPVPPSATPDPMGKPVPPTEKRVLASIDLSTGRVTELRDFDACDQCGTEWPRSYPRWSPDRTQIAYTWAPTLLPGPQPPKDPAVFVADADGRNAHQVSAFGNSPGWSPDGARIVYQGIQYSWTGTWVPGTVVSSSSDIYTVRPDGTDLRRLTSDGASYLPRWDIDGRIWFSHGDADNWVMDADGGNATLSSLPPPPQELADAAVQPTP